jgi:hypothetical protein
VREKESKQGELIAMDEGDEVEVSDEAEREPSRVGLALSPCAKPELLFLRTL